MDNRSEAFDLSGRENEIVIYKAVEKKMHQASRHPQKALLIYRVFLAVVVRAAVSLIIHQRKQQEGNVGQEEKIAQALCEVRRDFLVAKIVQIHGKPEHEHGAKDRKDDLLEFA